MKTENEIIAKFMGLIPEEWRLTALHKKRIYWCTEDGGMGVTADMLRYHTSWDWLMPVVEKIEEVALNVVIETACVRIDCFDDAYPEYHSVTTFESQDDTKLKVLYRAIVAYIRWYNSQNF